MVESTVILSARICAELATLVPGACALADFSPIAEIQSAATAEIETKQRKGVFIRGRAWLRKVFSCPRDKKLSAFVELQMAIHQFALKF
jgi:hypothetical protein